MVERVGLSTASGVVAVCVLLVLVEFDGELTLPSADGDSEVCRVAREIWLMEVPVDVARDHVGRSEKFGIWLTSSSSSGIVSSLVLRLTSSSTSSASCDEVGLACCLMLPESFDVVLGAGEPLAGGGSG